MARAGGYKRLSLLLSVALRFSGLNDQVMRAAALPLGVAIEGYTVAIDSVIARA